MQDQTDQIIIKGEMIILDGFSEIRDEVTFNFLSDSITIIPGFYAGTFAYLFPVSVENGKKVVEVDKEIAKRLKSIERVPMIYHNGVYYPLL